MKWLLDRKKSTDPKPAADNAPSIERIRLKEQIKQGQDRQKRSEEQIHIRTKAMEAAADGIFIIDATKPDFPYIYVNRSFQKITGFSKKEILGQNYFLHFGAYSHNPRILEEIKHDLHQGKSFYAEINQLKKNGEKYWNLLRITPARDTEGKITHYVGNKTDVTTIRQKDMEIIEKREELLHMTRVGKLAEFVSSLAHEISQPLTAILSYAQAAQRMLGDKEPQLQEVLQYIINDDQRAAEVVRRLRSMLKKNGSDMKPVDINGLINETVMLINTDLNLKKCVLKIDLDSDLPLIHGDRIQIQQVLLNLISNSFDAMENNQGPREMSIRTSRKGPGTVKVALKDSGCGIPAQDLPKLFDHFFTSKKDGLGMGLSISRSIVEAHGGQLDVENNLDRGATFYFTLPY
jgi:two-component system, LuxR family, sensor kinase FixL